MEEKEKTNKRSKRKKKKDKNTKSQENYFKTIRAIVEGKTVTIIMFLNTLFALVGDDIRLWLFTKDFDLYFNILFAISLLLFVLELLFNSLIRSIYAEPIFFYLDIIATLSLVPDVEWLMLLLTICIDRPPEAESNDIALGSVVSSSAASGRAQRLIKSIRLIRLIRIIKLYKYAVKSNTEEEEAKLREQKKLSQTAQQAALKREIEPSRLGKVMSDTIIRKVIIGILIMLMVLPLITYAGIDYTMEYGLDKIFWFGRSNCNTIGGDFYCTRDNWLTQDGWNEILYFFSDSTKINEDDNKATNLLWLYAPDYSQNGKMAEITSIQRNDKQVWKQNDECAGFKISNKNCKYRTDELEVVSFIPQICQKEWKDDCKYLVSYARYSIRDAVVNEAILQFATTVFTCLIISVASLLFASDTQNIIVKPITKVVKIILRFVDDPLQQPDPPNTFEDDLKDSTSKYLKTTELEKIIYRIGTLLQMSFGHLGANIIRENVVLLATTKNDNSLEIMKAGRRIDAIFMVCSINYYSSILETLKENSVVYINKVAKIVHQCVHQWDGSINRNDGEYYLLTWKLPNIEGGEHEKNQTLQKMKTELADKSLIAAVKVIAELRRSSELIPYYQNPNLINAIGRNIDSCVSFAIHQGSTIEGAIGSEYKIDACYLSPQIAVTYRIQRLCKHYDMPILITENLYNLMSLKARYTLRKIDVIVMKESQDPKGIFSFDVSYTSLDNTENIPEDHQTGELIKLEQYANINIEGFKDQGVDYMFTLDNDVVESQSNIQEFNPIFRQLFKCYIAGEWGDAFECIQRCLECWEDDGPTKAIQFYLSAFQYQQPNQWNGYRNIEDDLNKIYRSRIRAQQLDEQSQEDSKNQKNEHVSHGRLSVLHREASMEESKENRSAYNRNEQSTDFVGLDSKTGTINSNITDVN